MSENNEAVKGMLAYIEPVPRSEKVDDLIGVGVVGQRGRDGGDLFGPNE
jgi:hypothetical protein